MSHERRVVKARPERPCGSFRFPTHLTTAPGGRRLLVDARSLGICPSPSTTKTCAEWRVGVPGVGRGVGSRKRSPKGGQRCQEGFSRIVERKGERKRRAKRGRKRSGKENRRGRGAVRRSRGSNPKSREQSPALHLPKLPPLALPHNASRPGLPKPGRTREVSPTPIVPIRSGPTARYPADAGFWLLLILARFLSAIRSCSTARSRYLAGPSLQLARNVVGNAGNSLALRLAARRIPNRPGRARLAQHEVLHGDGVLVLPGRVADARPGRVVRGQRDGAGRLDRDARVGL
jgi:hypothetical protein